MKKKRNKGKKKGFSMVELLAAITILGILMAVAIGSVSVYLEKSRKDYFDSQRKNIIAAAKSYYQSNKSELPKNIGDVSEVDLKTLINDKYIGEVYSNDKKTPCDADETKVKVVMSDKGKYKYSSTFVCQGIESEDETTGGDDATFEYDKIKNEDTYTLTVKSNNGTKIKHYTYTVTKNGYNYVGPIEEKVNTANLNTRTFTIDRESDNPMNTFIATVRIVDEKGKTHVGVITFTLGDDIKPTCTNIWTDLHEWSKTKTQNITFDCTDPKDTNGYASGCQKDKYHVRLKTKADVDTYKNGIKIKDNAGNEFTCPIQDTIRLDFEAPSCPTITGYEKTSSANITTPGSLPKIASGTWSKKWIFTQATGSKDNAVGKNDNGAGFDYYKVSTTGTTDPANGEKQDYRNVNSEGLSTVSYQACDKLGNCTTSCGSYSVKLDRTPPTNPTTNLYKWNGTTTPTSSSGLSTYPNNTWFSGRVFTNATGSTDALRGGVYYQYNTSGVTGTKSNVTATYRNITEEGISYISYRACDGLDNCTSYNSTKTIKLDRTAPTVPKVGLYKWKNVSTRPTSSSGLGAYSNNTWFDGKVFTQASGSTDNLTSVSYQFTSSGATGANTNSAGSSRNIEPEGISYISYRACDEASNCSAHSSTSTIKLDRSAPNCSPYGGSTTWSSAASRTVGVDCTDPNSGSGCVQAKYSKDVTDEAKTKKIKFTVKDVMGHSRDCENTYNIYLDRTKPTVGLTGTSDNYTLTGTGSDSLSGIGGYHWSGGSWASASGSSISKVKHTTAGGSETFYVKDAAGNSASKSISNVYKLCNKKTTPAKNKDYPSCSTKHANISIYKWDYDSRDCSGDSYTRKYDFKQYSCICHMDAKTSSYCSNDIENVTSCYHGPSYSVIHYKHNDNGKAACKAEKAVNSYTTKVCNSDAYSSTSGSVYDYHGYRFYEGAVQDWNEFNSGWTTGSKSRPPDSASASAACKFACEKKYS